MWVITATAPRPPLAHLQPLPYPAAIQAQLHQRGEKTNLQKETNDHDCSIK